MINLLTRIAYNRLSARIPLDYPLKVGEVAVGALQKGLRGFQSVCLGAYVWLKLDRVDERLGKSFERAVEQQKEKPLPPCLNVLKKAFGSTGSWGSASEQTFDRELIRKYSLLKGEGKEKDVLKLLSCLSDQSLEEVLELVGDPKIIKQFSNASEQQSKLRGASGRGALLQLAKEYVEELQSLEKGERSLLFAGTPTEAAQLNLPNLSDHPVAVEAQKFLLSDEKAEKLAEMIVAKASPHLGDVLKNGEIIDLIKTALKKKDHLEFGLLSRSLTEGSPLWKRILLAPAEFARKWVEGRVKGICENIYNQISSKLDVYLTPAQKKELWDLLMTDSEVAPNLEKVVQSFLEKRMETSRELVKEVIPMLGENLPPLIPLVIEQMDYGTLGRPEKSFWLEWKKGKTLTLTVYFSDKTLCYRKIDPKLVDELFFLRLFSYQKQEGVAFSLEEVEKNLLATLGSPETKELSQPGPLGRLNEYIQNKGIDLEKIHFFAQRDAFIDLWLHPERKAHASLLDKRAIGLASEAERLFEMKKISEEEFKATFATCHDALTQLHEERWRSLPRGKIFPAGLKEKLNTVFSQIGMTSANQAFIKALLIENLGLEVEKSVDDLLECIKEEIGHIEPQPSSPLISDEKWNVRQVARKVYGLGIRCFIQPHLFVAQLVSDIFARCFPTISRRLTLLKYRFLAKSASFLFLSEEQKALCRGAIDSFRQMMLQEGRLNFSVTPQVKELEQMTLKPVFGTFRSNQLKGKKPSSTAALFSEKIEPLTKENVISVLNKWEKQAKSLSSDQRLLFLNSRLMTLPVPGKSDFWDDVNDFDGCLKALGMIAFSLHDTSLNCSLEQENQCMVNLFTLFAIVQYLENSDQNPFQLLEGGVMYSEYLGDAQTRARFQANPQCIYHWLEQANFRIVDSRVAKRFGEVFEYLFELKSKGWVVEELTLFSYFSGNKTVRERAKSYLDDNRSFFIFNEREEDKIFVYTDENYYGHFLTDPKVRDRLKTYYGLGENSPKAERVAHLYANPMLIEDTENYTGVLPYSIHMLRNLHRLCNHKLRCFEQRRQVEGLALKNIHDTPYKIEEGRHMVRDVLHAITLGAVSDECQEGSSLDRMPGNYTKIKGENFQLDRIFRRADKSGIVLGLSHSVKATRVTQAEIINGKGDAPVRLYFNQKIEQNSFLMIFAKYADEPVRILSWISENLELLDKPIIDSLLECFLLREDLLRDQLTTHPEFLATLDEVLRKGIAYLKSTHKPYKDLLFFLVIAHLEAETLGVAPEGHLDLLLKNFSHDSFFPFVAGLVYSIKEPAECSVLEKRKAVITLLFANMSFDLKYNLFSKQEKLIFEETFSKWEGTLQTAMDRDEELRKYVLGYLLKQKGVTPDLSKGHSWQGSYPVYSLGDFSINVKTGKNNLEENPFRSQIEPYLHRIMSEEQVKKCTIGSLSCGEITIWGAGIFVEVDAASSSFQFYTNYNGKKYRFVSKNSAAEEEAKISYWLEVSEESTAQMLRMDKGCVTHLYRVKNNEDSITVLNEESLGESLEVVPLTAGLAPLTWFQRRDEIHCLVSSQNPDEIKRIDFRKLNLKFKVVEGRAMSCGDYPGFWIAKDQQHPLLASFGRSLLLENKEGKQKVLLPEDSLLGALLSGLGKRFNIGESHFLQGFAESYSPFGQEGVFDYTLAPDGRLISSDPAAILHLFCYQLANGNLQEAEFYLRRLEGASKREKLPERVQHIVLLLQMAAALSENPDLILFSLRIAAMMQVNSVSQRTDLYELKTLYLLGFVLTQFTYQKYLEKKKCFFKQLTPFQELDLIHSLKGMAQILIGTIDLDKFCSDYGALASQTLQFAKKFIEEAAFSADILERSRELQAKHAPQLAQRNPFIKRLLQGMMTEDAADPLGSFLGSTVSTGHTSKAIEQFLVGLLRGKRFLTQAEKKFNFEKELISFEKLPTKFSEIEAPFVARHFFSYYLLAYGEAPKDCDEELFHTKAEELKRSLSFLQGKYKDQTVGVPIQILCTLIHSSHRITFPHPSELREEYLNKKEEKMKSLTKQCAFDLSSESAMQSLYTLSQGWMRSIATTAALTLVGFGGVSTFYRLGRTLFKGAKAWGKASRRFDFEEGAPLSSALLPTELAAKLSEMDLEIERSLREFSKGCLEKTPQKKSSPPSLALTGDLVTDRHIQKVQESLQDYAARPGEEVLSFKGTEALQRQLSVTSQQLKEMLDQEENDLVNKAEEIFHRVEDNLEGLQSSGRKVKHKRFDFETLLTAFLKDDRELFVNFTDEELAFLYQRLYSYLIFVTRQGQMERALKKIEAAKKQPSKENLDAVARELTQRRSYQFGAIPERLLKGCLLFEYKQNTLLWEKQTAQIHQMLTSGEERSFVELIMGSGKTFFGIPLTDFISADGQQIPINIWPAAMKRTNIAQIGKQAEGTFSQDAYALSFSRNERFSPHELEGRLLILLQALKERSQINMSKEDAQALQLIWLEHIYQFIEKKTDTECFNLLTEIVRLFRVKGKAVIDEAHEIFRRDQMLNHPIGQKMKLEEEDIAVIEKFASALTDPEVIKIVDVRDNLRTWKPEVYMDQIRPLIAKSFCKYFSNPELLIYFLDQEAELPPVLMNHPDLRAICLARGIMNVIAPKTLSGIVSVNFGPSQKGSEKFARPYNGNKNPKEESTIQNPFEACLKTFLQQLTNRLSEADAKEFISYLKVKARGEGKLFDQALSETPTGKQFKIWCPGQTLESHSLPQATKLLNQNKEAILMHARYLIAPTIRFFTSHFSSNSQNFASMFPAYFSDTGTPYNDETYPVGTKPIWDKGTTGETVEWLMTHCNKPESILEIATADPAKAADEILEKGISSNTKAVIDCGALFRNVDNETIARKMAKKFTNGEGVAFFDSEQQMVMLENNRIKAFEDSHIQVSKRVAFFDDSHTFAADIPLDLSAEGLVTLGENTTLTRLSQAVWRMRGLKKGSQTIRLVVNNQVRKIISGDKPCMIEQIIQFVSKNEAKQVAEDNFFADYQKINNAIRSVVIDKLLFASNANEMAKTFKTFQELLLTTMETNPVSLYGYPLKRMKPQEAIERFKQQHLKNIKSNPSFTEEEKQRIEEEFAKIGQGNYPEHVLISQKGGKISFEFSESLGLEQVESVHQQQTNEQQVQVEQMVEQNLNQALVGGEKKVKLAPSKSWDYDRDYNNLDWLKLSNVNDRSRSHPLLYPLNQVLALADIPLLQEYAHAFSGNIWCSENFVGREDGYVSKPLATPFGQQQKPIYQVLIVQNEGSYSIGLLDQEDAAFWRHKMEQKEFTIKAALFDIGLNRVVATGKNRLLDEELAKSATFKRDIARLRFLKGSVAFTGKQILLLKPWIEKHGVFKMHTLFNELHERFGIAKKPGSKIEDLFLLLEEEKSKGVSASHFTFLIQKGPQPHTSLL